MLSEQLLQRFVEVAQAASLNKAAHRLRIPATTLSRQLAALEADVGTRLFQRTGQGTTLTKAGAAFLAETTEILERFERARYIARQATPGDSPTLRVGHIPGATDRILNIALRELHHRFPTLRVITHHGLPCDHLARVESGELDFAFARQQADRDGISQEILRYEQLWAGFSADHPLTELASVRLADLNGVRLIACSRKLSPATYDWWAHLFEQANVEPDLSFCQSSDVGSMLIVAEAGLGVAVVTEDVMNTYPGTTVIRRPLSGRCAIVPLSMVWSSKNESSYLSAFVQLVREANVFLKRDKVDQALV